MGALGVRKPPPRFLFAVRANGRTVASAAGLVNAHAAAIGVVRDGYPVVEIVDQHDGAIVEVGELNEWGDVVFYGGADWEVVADGSE